MISSVIQLDRQKQVMRMRIEGEVTSACLVKIGNVHVQTFSIPNIYSTLTSNITCIIFCMQVYRLAHSSIITFTYNFCDDELTMRQVIYSKVCQLFKVEQTNSEMIRIKFFYLVLIISSSSTRLHQIQQRRNVVSSIIFNVCKK